MGQLTINEIAEQIGVHRTSALRRAEKEQWSYVEKQGRGGKAKLYLTDRLPQDVQLALLAKGDQLPVVIEPEKQAVSVSAPPPMTQQMEAKVRQKAALLSLYERALSCVGWGGKVQAMMEFEQAYNSGIAWPELYAALGPVSWKTLEKWRVTTRKNGNDCFYLADRRGKHRQGASGLTQQQTDIFLRCVLRPNKPRIAEALRVAHAVMSQTGIENGHSEATYRRWLQTWKSRNYDVWVWCREGSKAWNDKCAFYIERDMSLLSVGDVIVADGHNLNFEVINPWTGKAVNHATLILFYDMASNMPLGWEIMPTENTQAISAALRRSVLRLGKYPRVVYLDNGRAFKARFFSNSSDFETAGYAGVYERMGCQTIYAWPYHGQSKTVERFFGTFAELERLLPTYTGTSIENKPPRMLRGEKKHRALHDQQFGGMCLSFEDAHALLATWFDTYARRPQKGHLNGRCPLEVFEPGRGEGIDRAQLTWLMMSMEEKTIHRNGITFRGQNYYHPALVGRRHAVQIRYDLQDQSSLWVLDMNGALICEATPVMKIHPAASQLGNEADKELLRQHIEYKRGQEKAAAGTATELLRLEVLPEHRRQVESIVVGAESGSAPAVTQHKSTKIKPINFEQAKRASDEDMRLTAEAKIQEINTELMRLSEPDRYERLLELEAQGVSVDAQWAGFMEMFEKTKAYTDYAEYWQQRRLSIGLLHRAVN